MKIIREMLLTNHNRPKKKLVRLKGIVMHWTANTARGATAIANWNYFNTCTRACSSHYIADDKGVVQCIPDDEVAYHVGAQSYTKIGQAIKEGIYSPNFFLIGIEMCVNSDGNWDMTYRNSVELTARLLVKHDMTIKDLYRHFDITGKDCPKMMIEEAAWNKFRADIQIEINKIDPQKAFKRTLVLSNMGDDVKLVQERLNELGFAAGSEDGIFGYRTLTSVQHFQVKSGLKPSGIVDFFTFKKILIGGF